jgi:hypothetical protein
MGGRSAGWRPDRERLMTRHQAAWPFTEAEFADEAELRALRRDVSDLPRRLEVWEPVEWTTREGDTMTIGQMTPGHRLRLYRYIWRHGRTYRRRLANQLWDALSWVNDPEAEFEFEIEAERLEETPIPQVLRAWDVVRQLEELICVDTERWHSGDDLFQEGS